MVAYKNSPLNLEEAHKFVAALAAVVGSGAPRELLNRSEANLIAVPEGEELGLHEEGYTCERDAVAADLRPGADSADQAGHSSNRHDISSSEDRLRPEISSLKRAKARRLDQFYTRGDVVKALLDWYRVKRIEHDLCRFQRTRIIEPSAGTGAFLRMLPLGSVGYDLDPKASKIVQGDFLVMPLPADEALLVIGNPPFGKNASMAIRFFNHAAAAASVIAFIVPLTFQKVSVQNRLDFSFYLLDEMPVPKDAFIFEGERKHVPAVFQIWVRQSSPRQKLTLPTSHPDFEFLPAGQANKANFAIQRVGANAGMVHRNFNLSSSSHYFIKATSAVEAIMRELDLASIARRTSGNPSLSKGELVESYAKAISGKRSSIRNPALNSGRLCDHG